jgi:hypothetical protein
MAVRLVLAAGLVLLLTALGVTLAQSAPRAAGSNHVPEIEEAVKLKRKGGRHCQDGETIPGNAAALRLLIGTYGRPVPEMSVSARRPGGERVTAGERSAGGREGRVDIPVERVENSASGVRVCVRVGGPGRSVLYGAGGRVRLEWMRPGSESWFALAPTVAHRFGLGRASVAGSLLLPFAALLLLAAWAAAVRLVLREVGS